MFCPLTPICFFGLAVPRSSNASSKCCPLLAPLVFQQHFWARTNSTALPEYMCNPPICALAKKMDLSVLGTWIWVWLCIYLFTLNNDFIILIWRCCHFSLHWKLVTFGCEKYFFILFITTQIYLGYPCYFLKTTPIANINCWIVYIITKINYIITQWYVLTLLAFVQYTCIKHCIL